MFTHVDEDHRGNTRITNIPWWYHESTREKRLDLWHRRVRSSHKKGVYVYSTACIFSLVFSKRDYDTESEWWFSHSQNLGRRKQKVDCMTKQGVFWPFEQNFNIKVWFLQCHVLFLSAFVVFFTVSSLHLCCFCAKHSKHVHHLFTTSEATKIFRSRIKGRWKTVNIQRWSYSSIPNERTDRPCRIISPFHNQVMHTTNT